MSSTTPLTDAINALTTYANEITGQSDTTLSDAVESLVDGYGGGDSIWDKIVDRSITEIDDADGVIKKIGTNAFGYCSKLYRVNFPSVTELSPMAFYECGRLRYTNFPSVTSIGNSSFYNCGNLHSIDFPVLSNIASYAFQKCTTLLSVILRKSDSICTLANKNAFYDTQINSQIGYIYVPSALIETYKTATNWSNYADKFRALEDYTVDGTITGELDPNKI